MPLTIYDRNKVELLKNELSKYNEHELTQLVRQSLDLQNYYDYLMNLCNQLNEQDNNDKSDLELLISTASLFFNYIYVESDFDESDNESLSDLEDCSVCISGDNKYNITESDH